MVLKGDFLSQYKNQTRTLALLGAWFVVHAFLSNQRGFWVDEWFRHAQMQMGLLRALKDLFSEISPFGPGEILLGYTNKFLFSSFVSEELWMRLHSVTFGLLTFWLSVRSKEKYFVFLSFFSVALTAMATQFRPYSALVYGGALAFYLIRKREPLDKADRVLFWFNLFMGHIYGICFAGFALFFRREYLIVAVSVVYVIAIICLNYSMRPPFDYVRDMPPALEVIKQSIGTLGNPQKFGYFFLVFCALGLWDSIRRNPRQGLQLAALLMLTTAGPVMATYFGRYYFLPRQVVGGSLVFLGLAAMGLRLASDTLKTKSKSASQILVLSAAVAISGSWLAFVLGKPPFIDQPLHRFKQIARESKAKGYKNVFWVDSGTSGSAFFYFKSVYSDAVAQPFSKELGGLRLNVLCVSNNAVCVYAPTDAAFVWDAPRLVQEANVRSLIDGTAFPFDLVVHGLHRFPYPSPTPLLRTW
jgi:hypothetical protein